MNRLVDAASSYLRRHADDLVDWYPWCDEAFDRARSEDRPVLLSIGFGACHLCHVMQRESFREPVTSELMNQRFVNVIVDRDERPDLEAFYLDAVTRYVGNAGWPATLFLLPDGTPFYGGTYFPATRQRGSPSFREVLDMAARFYADQRTKAIEQGRAVVEIVSALAQLRPPSQVDTTVVDDAARTLKGEFDEVHGGFGGAPKFPPASALEFLLRYHGRTGDVAALRIVTKTLDEMARGGIYDHVGGGFHRYAVDAGWKLPHFEKLLVDNALLASAYARGWAITGASLYRAIAVETIDYLNAALWDERAVGFAAGREAETGGVEGGTYIWTLPELREVLPADDLALAIETYGVTEEGNFRGANVLHIARDPSDRVRLGRIRGALRLAREARSQPALIPTLQADANGIALAALAEVGLLLGRGDYVERAERLARSVVSRVDSGGQLPHVLDDSASDGFLDDYVCVATGFLELSQATGDPDWLLQARLLVRRALAEFGDADRGGCFFSRAALSGRSPRLKLFADRPAPSGNALLARVLMTLAAVSGDQTLEERAAKIVAFAPHALVRVPSPVLIGQLLSAVEVQLGPRRTVVVVGPKSPARAALAAAAARRWGAVLLVVGSEGSEEAGDLALLSNKQAAANSPLAYVCDERGCSAPVADLEELARLVDPPGGRAAPGAGIDGTHSEHLYA